MSLTVASYNVLADCYVLPERHPFTAPALLEPDRRRRRLVERIAALDADVVCLQEVLADFAGALAAALPAWECRFLKKAGAAPDGCAVLSRRPLTRPRELVFSGRTGHVAQIFDVEEEGILISVANTHLKWGAESATQARELAEALSGECVVCGDFNAGPETAEVRVFLGRGYTDAYAGTGAPTCNANRRARRIDFILHTPGLVSRPDPLPRIDDDTPLPSSTEPSDHLALRAELRWR